MSLPGIKGRVIGLTGPSGSGKSAVCELIRSWEQVFTLDADAVAHEVMENDTACRAALVHAYSPSILTAEGRLNRRALAEVVFHDPEKLTRLGEITYPFITAECILRMNKAFLTGARAAFLDAPTLFESGANSYCNQVVSVVSPREIRLRRILERDGITEEQALARINNQFENSYYISRSDFVIRNDSDWEHLRTETERCRSFLKL